MHENSALDLIRGEKEKLSMKMNSMHIEKEFYAKFLWNLYFYDSHESFDTFYIFCILNLSKREKKLLMHIHIITIIYNIDNFVHVWQNDKRFNIKRNIERKV